jgi:NAD(P)-dependent dehydrogenase (short-subunit alcohol dehydrogenase family)
VSARSLIHNAHYPGSAGFVEAVDPALLTADAIGNVAAPLALADAFVRAVRPGCESGLVLLSSVAARIPLARWAVHAAAEAGVEQLLRVLQRERARRGPRTVVVAKVVLAATTARAMYGSQKRPYVSGVGPAPRDVARFSTSPILPTTSSGTTTSGATR